MKKLKMYAILSIMSLAMIFVSCSKDDDVNVPYTPSANELNDAEKSGLIELVEIEKLHRDVYDNMNISNPCELFENLCNCDGNFMELLADKIEIYELDNPLTGNEKGVFSNNDIQIKYNHFLSISNSEMMDILTFVKDMEVQALLRIEEQINLMEGNADISEIYLNMLEESRCQISSIVDKIEHRIPIEHPEDPGNIQ